MSDRDPFDQLERVFDQFADLGLTQGSVAVDVVEVDDTIEVRADLPGYDPADIDVQLRDGRRLEIRATRSETREETEGTVHRRERRQESATRTVTLPTDVDEEGTEASYSNGVLTVRLPTRARDEESQTIHVS
jgi:HSP20 family protein